MPLKSRDIYIFWCLQARSNYLRICKKCDVLHVMILVSVAKLNGKRAWNMSLPFCGWLKPDSHCRTFWVGVAPSRSHHEVGSHVVWTAGAPGVHTTRPVISRQHPRLLPLAVALSTSLPAEGISSRFDIQFCACNSVWGVARIITRVLEVLKPNRLAGEWLTPHLGEGKSWRSRRLRSRNMNKALVCVHVTQPAVCVCVCVHVPVSGRYLGGPPLRLEKHDLTEALLSLKKKLNGSGWMGK